MSGTLTWSGRGPILDTPTCADSASVTSHTLMERDGSLWTVVASRVRDAWGAIGALGGGPASSRIVAAGATLLPVPEMLEPLDALLLPVVMQVLRAVEAVPEPGWTAVVASGGIRGEVLLALLPRCGARRTVRVATGEGAPGTVLADEAVTGDGAERAEKLGALLRGASAPVVAFEVRGDTATQLALLGALPPRSHLILLESTLAGTRTDVDFYRLVHKKNATVHGVPWSDPCDASRCERGLRLLRGPITAGWRPNPTAVQARAGLDPAVDEGNLLLLVWPEN